MPLDSVATMSRLDPSNLYRYTDESGAEQRIRSNRDALALRNRPNRHPIFEGELGAEERQVAILEAKSMFRWLNLGEVLGHVLSSGIETLLPGVTSDALLKVDRNRSGIYVIRVHTGKMHDGIMDTVGEGSVVLENHLDLVMFALTVNFSMALLDVIDIIVGFRVDACNPLQAFIPAIATELARQSWSAVETNPIFVASTLTGLVAQFVPVMADHYGDCLLQNPGTALLAFAKSVITLEQITRRISAVGSISDRIGALTGAPVGGVAGPLVTPMDTIIVVVGDPFTPFFTDVEYTGWEGDQVVESISSLRSMDEPPGIFPGEIVTVRGVRIIDDGVDARRFVFTDGYGNESLAEVVSSSVVGSTEDDFPLQEVQLRLPMELLGQVSVRVQGPRGPARVESPPLAEIVPRLISASPEKIFGHPGQGSTIPNNVHLKVEGFDSTRHQVHMGDVQKTFTPDGFRKGYIVPLLQWFSPGNYEVRVRWRQGSPMVGGDPPLMVRMLDVPQIHNLTPDPVVARGTINISGSNFGTFLDHQYGLTSVRFYADGGSPSGVAGTIRRVGDLGMDGSNQQSFLVVEVPNIAVEELDYEVTVSTPRGASARFPLTVVKEADPPYQRQLRNYRIADGVRDIQETAAQVMSWASHSPAPPGQRQWIVECVPTSCPDPPQSRTNVRLETLPETSPSHSSRELVSVPPGYPGQAAIPAENCGPCDGGTAAQSPHANWPATPDRWEDLGNQQIYDTIRLAGDITGVYTGSHARIVATPSQSADDEGPGPVRFIGDGIIVQSASNVEVDLTSSELAGSQILAIRSSSDVQVNINIPEGVSGSTSIGIDIENSNRVSVSGTIRRANIGIRVRNSTRVDLTNLNIHTHGSEGLGIDVDGGSMISLGTIDFYGGDGGTQDDRTGLRLRGGLADSRVSGVRFYGLATGMEVYDVERIQFSTLTIGSDGSPPQVGNLIGAIIEGGARDSVFSSMTVTGNDIGMEVRGGVGNIYTGMSFGSFNVGQVGAGNRLGMRVEGTGQPMEDNLFWGTSFNRNRQRHLELINLDNPGVFRAINLGASQAQAGVYPSLFDVNLLIQGCTDLELRNTVVRGGIDGIVIEDSSEVRLNGLECLDQTGVGLRAERSHGLEFFDGLIRGDSGGEPSSALDRGIHLIACSDFHFARFRVEFSNISGIEIEQAPEDSFGISRILGRKNLPGQTTPSMEPPRETTFAPFRRPPSIVETYSSQGMVRVLAQSGPAVYIHSGAGDISLGGMAANSFDGPGLYLRNTGSNISVMTSTFSRLTQAVGEHSGILVVDCEAGDIDIGIPDSGNNITRTLAWGVEIRNSRGVRVRGNYIGTEGQGTFPQANALGGIFVENSSDIEIGGADPVDGNLISGNSGHGIHIRGVGNGNPPLIHGNFIGTTADGTLDLANEGYGILVESTESSGGPGAANITENLVSSNTTGGIKISAIHGTDGMTSIHRNIVGRAFPFGVFGTFIGSEDNPGHGIHVADSSGVVVQENRIAWYDGDGIVLAASERCHIQDNAIFSHGGNGLSILDGSVRHIMMNNEFANNQGMGVHIESLSRMNTISAGEFRDNASGQIDLEFLTNDDVPAPLVCEVYTRQLDDLTRLVFVRGQVSPSLPDGTRVELFASNDNQNANRLLNATVSWDGHFHSMVTEIEPGAPVPGVIATVTDAAGNTSPFGVLNPDDPRCHDEPWSDDRVPPPGVSPGQLPWMNFPVVMDEDDRLVLTTFDRAPIQAIDTGLEETHTLRSPSLVRMEGAPRLLAFTAIDDEDQQHVYIHNLDTPGSSVQIPGGFDASWHPRFEPSGRHLAFVSDEEGTPSVFLLGLDTDDIVRLTDDSGIESWPDWSPRGDRLVYQTESNGTANLHVVSIGDDAASPVVLELDRLGHQVNRPAWGLHGDTIAFEWSDSDDTPRVGWVDLRTMRTHTVPLVGEVGHRMPAWAPGRGDTTYLLVTIPGIEPETDAVLAIGALGYPRWLISPAESTNHYRAATVGASSAP